MYLQNHLKCTGDRMSLVLVGNQSRKSLSLNRKRNVHVFSKAYCKNYFQ